MLTLKHIDNQGYETIIEVPQVRAFPSHPVPENHPKGSTPRVCYDIGESTYTIESGDVFVMNDSGQTVASYRSIGS